MKWAVLINPTAGRRPVDTERLEAALAAAGVEATLHQPADRSEMKEAALAAAIDHDLAVVGGDGTVSLIVDALMHAAPARMPVVGILPAGTGCDLLKTFGLPSDLESAARHLAGDSTYRIDVGRLDGGWGRRHFVNVAQAGVGAAAAQTAVHISRRLGPGRYPLAFAARLPRFPVADIDLRGGRGHRGKALAVIMANAQFFAGGWNVAPKAMLVDGELDVQVIAARKRQAFAIVPRIIKGTHLSLPEVSRMSLPSLSLHTSTPWPVEADGDYLGMTPVDARVLPAAVQLKI